MALVMHFVCSRCRFDVEAWEIGRPYFVDENGQKEYIPHPTPIPLELRPRVRLEGDFLCLGCAKVLRRDQGDTSPCPRCRGIDVLEATELEGKTCPRCHQGVFAEDISRTVIT
ncbi:MAG: hypothetical protein U0795_20390 [Pirellulales bacterium]